MDSRTKVYFVADVHLGSTIYPPKERQKRFVDFLRSINQPQTRTLYLLGDIWDFWYEYKYVVPKYYFQVFSAIEDLISSGVDVYFMPGNHDVWAFSYFEEIGMKMMEQPTLVNLDGKVFCLGHGDILGKLPKSVRLINTLFRSKIAQWFFSVIHPTIAFGIGDRCSRSSRKKHLKRKEKGRPALIAERLPIYEYAKQFLKETHVDYFIFGHYHIESRLQISEKSEFLIVKDWFESSPYLVWDTISVTGGNFQKIE